ncbi:MAG: nuclear transport factor 2 family protein [Bacteroidota bacterium]
MKALLIGAIALITLNLNAQEMKDPQHTVTGLFIATDQQDWDQVSSSFHAQVRLDYSSMNGNPAATLTPEEIITAWKGILPGFEHTHHQLGNMTSHVKGDSATVFCYGTASHYLGHEAGNLWIVVGTYDFQLVRIDDGNWKIASMTFDFKYQDGNTSLPEKAIGNIK